VEISRRGAADLQNRAQTRHRVGTVRLEAER
jgi:hypothetical protein